MEGSKKRAFWAVLLISSIHLTGSYTDVIHRGSTALALGHQRQPIKLAPGGISILSPSESSMSPHGTAQIAIQRDAVSQALGWAIRASSSKPGGTPDQGRPAKVSVFLRTATILERGMASLPHMDQTAQITVERTRQDAASRQPGL
jgi:hypothetical protein